MMKLKISVTSQRQKTYNHNVVFFHLTAARIVIIFPVQMIQHPKICTESVLTTFLRILIGLKYLSDI